MYPKSTQAYLKGRMHKNKKTMYSFKIAIAIMGMSLVWFFILTLFENQFIEQFFHNNTANFIQTIAIFFIAYLLLFGFCLYKINSLFTQNKHIKQRLLEGDQ